MGYFYRQIKEAKRVYTPHKHTHKNLKGNVVVISLLFLDISQSANMDALLRLQSRVLWCFSGLNPMSLICGLVHVRAEQRVL